MGRYKYDVPLPYQCRKHRFGNGNALYGIRSLEQLIQQKEMIPFPAQINHLLNRLHLLQEKTLSFQQTILHMNGGSKPHTRRVTETARKTGVQRLGSKLANSYRTDEARLSRHIGTGDQHRLAMKGNRIGNTMADKRMIDIRHMKRFTLTATSGQ